MSRAYCLCNKDKEVLRFREVMLDSVTYYEETVRLGQLPYGFTDINYWLDSRQAAKHRKHVYKLMQDLGCDKIEGYIRLLHCTSINDTFWVREIGEDIQWSDVSLYQNKFDESLSEAVIKQAGNITSLSSTSPEFGTEGMYSKCCEFDNGNLYLYKTGSNKYKIEPELEVKASRIYDILSGHNSVLYSLTEIHDKQVSKCKIFTNEDVGFVPAYRFIQDNKTLPALMQLYKSELFNAMLVADAICLNVDRHNGNHGVLVDNDTLEVLGMAPLFDFNRSYIFGDIPKIGQDFISVAKAMLTHSIRKRLLECDLDKDDKIRADMILNR